LLQENKKFKTHRHLPAAPVKKYPISTSLPVAKLRLCRNIFGTNDVKGGQRPIIPPSKPFVRNWPNLYPVRTSPKHSYYHVNNETSSKMNNLSEPIQAKKTSFFNHVHESNRIQLQNLTIDQIKRNSSIRKSAPFAPHSSYLSSSSSSSSLMNSSKSLKDIFKNEFKHLVKERKKMLQLSEVKSNLDQTQLISFNRNSESDLNALLHLYSYPPDPVLEHIPPPGAANFQGILQAYLHPSITLRPQERSPFFKYIEDQKMLSTLM